MGPYDPWEIARRIEQRRVDLGLSVKELCADPVLVDIGLGEKSRYSFKKNGKEPFTLPQISRLAVLLQGWTGFPFLPRELGEIIDALRRKRDS